MAEQKPIFAFTTKSNAIAKRLNNEVIIKHDDKSIKVIALWDTGATGSCISADVVRKLSLIPTGKKNISTPAGISVVNTYLVDITLPNNVKINGIEVCDSEIGDQGLGALIGMDIINLGDFAVSNFDGKTTFSFRTPSVHETDYVTQIKVQNKIGTHGKGNRKRKK